VRTRARIHYSGLPTGVSNVNAGLSTSWCATGRVELWMPR
jgi:hypothetical protein